MDKWILEILDILDNNNNNNNNKTGQDWTSLDKSRQVWTSGF